MIGSQLARKTVTQIRSVHCVRFCFDTVYLLNVNSLLLFLAASMDVPCRSLLPCYLTTCPRRCLWTNSVGKKPKSRQVLLADLEAFESQKGSKDAELTELKISDAREENAPGKRKHAEDCGRKAKKTNPILLLEPTTTEPTEVVVDHAKPLPKTGKTPIGGVAAPNLKGDATIRLQLVCALCQKVYFSKQGLAYHVEHQHTGEVVQPEDRPKPGGPRVDNGCHIGAEGHDAQIEGHDAQIEGHDAQIEGHDAQIEVGRLRAIIKAMEEDNHNKDDQIKLLIEQRNTARKTTRLECGVCFMDYSATEPGLVMLPCRHLAMCRNCASTLRAQGPTLKCPICCAVVLDTLEIYVPST